MLKNASLAGTVIDDTTIPEFAAYSISHIVVLACIAMLSWLAYTCPSRTSLQARVRISVGLAVIWGGLEGYWVGIAILQGSGRLVDRLPLHLCDISIFMVFIALLTRWRPAFEFSYFLGLGGTLQALLTPDLQTDFPSSDFFRFFIGHGGIVLCVFYLMGAFGLRPYPASIVRVLIMGYLFLAAAGLFNWVAGTNYGYLCYKPSQASLLDKLGAWPWYLIWMQMLAILSVFLLYVPFLVYDSMKKTQGCYVEHGNNT